MPRSRMLVDVCKTCGGWVSIGSTIDEEDATEYPTTVTLRVPDPDLGDYADPEIGGCRCPLGAHEADPAKTAEYLRWLEWFESTLSRTWCY